MDGSRVRLRLLDDVEINETVVPKGSYLYATMSGFGNQRVKGSVKSILVDDELVKVSLSLYDTDGLEGRYIVKRVHPMGNAGYTDCLPANEQRAIEGGEEIQGQTEVRHICVSGKWQGEKEIEA